MDRTAEEFVHQLPTGRWFVGDFVGRREGQETFLVETARGRSVAELTTAEIEAAGLPTYGRKSSAKRAAQQMIERVLGVCRPMPRSFSPSTRTRAAIASRERSPISPRAFASCDSCHPTARTGTSASSARSGSTSRRSPVSSHAAPAASAERLPVARQHSRRSPRERRHDNARAFAGRPEVP